MKNILYILVIFSISACMPQGPTELSYAVYDEKGEYCNDVQLKEDSSTLYLIDKNYMDLGYEVLLPIFNKKDSIMYVSYEDFIVTCHECKATEAVLYALLGPYVVSSTKVEDVYQVKLFFLTKDQFEDYYAPVYDTLLHQFYSINIDDFSIVDQGQEGLFTGGEWAPRLQFCVEN